MRRFLCSLLACLFLHLVCLPYSGVAAAADQARESQATIADGGDLMKAAQPPEPPVAFKAGVKYDPVSHQWKDIYSGKSVDLGIPGVAGKYGDVIADGTTPGGGPSAGNPDGFPVKKFIVITVFILGVATAITLPIVLGIHHKHNHHHQVQQQQNQLAVYSYFHNNTLPIPKIPVGPPPFIPHGGEGGGEGGGNGPPG